MTEIMTNLLGLARALIPVVEAAGRLELGYYRAGERHPDVMGKADGSPVTLADQEAEKLILAALADLAPGIPVVGEEASAAGHVPDVSGGTFFLVDALDGTREFISGGGDFTVNIGLLQNFVPVMGIIYAPATGDLYFGAADEAYRIAPGGAETRISVRQTPAEGLTVVGSRTSDNNARVQEILKGRNVLHFVKRSSSLKFCIIAAGEADFFPRFGPTCEWDTAAGEAILKAAGGSVTQMDGRPLKYGKDDAKFLNPSFLAFAGT